MNTPISTITTSANSLARVGVESEDKFHHFALAVESNFLGVIVICCLPRRSA